jgi:hypothetical protein
MSDTGKIIADLEALAENANEAARLQSKQERSEQEDQRLAALIKKVCGIAAGYDTARHETAFKANAPDPKLTCITALSMAHTDCEMLTSTEQDDRHRRLLLDIIQDTASEVLRRVRGQVR